MYLKSILLVVVYLSTITAFYVTEENIEVFQCDPNYMTVVLQQENTSESIQDHIELLIGEFEQVTEKFVNLFTTCYDFSTQLERIKNDMECIQKKIEYFQNQQVNPFPLEGDL